jgi:molybdate transport system substrate-binding protein
MQVSIKPAILATSLFATAAARAEEVTIATASSLKPAMETLAARFSTTNPKNSIKFVFGSSGKLITQIKEGAPFDIFFSADLDFPRELQKAGLAATAPKVFATGQLVLWSTLESSGISTLQALTNSNISRIAIANPKLAPYGARAEEALRAAGVYEKVKAKLVYGNDVAQAAQFAQTDNAQVAFIALSLALSPELARKGTYSLVPTSLHQPLEQGFVITKRAAGNALAQSFARFIETPEAATIFKQHGFNSLSHTPSPQTNQSR